ncbi:MAG: Aldehyde dehydrogenase, partial [uncultured Blastococcus sp.]
VARRSDGHGHGCLCGQRRPPRHHADLRVDGPRQRRGRRRLPGARRRRSAGDGRPRPVRRDGLGGPGLRRAQAAAGRLPRLPRPAAARAGRPGPPRERQAARRRDPRDHAGHRPPRLGRRARQEGTGLPQGVGRHARGQPRRLPGVPAARRHRRHRPVELPGVHADGVDRLRAGRGQRRRLQALGAHPRRRRLAGRRVAGGGARLRGRVPGRHRFRLDRCRALRCRGGQAGVHRLGTDRPEGHGGVRGDAHPGAHGARRQGRDDRRRRRRRGRRRRCRGLGLDEQRRADLHRDRAGLRHQRGLRPVRRGGHQPGAEAPPGFGRRGVVRPDDHGVPEGRRPAARGRGRVRRWARGPRGGRSQPVPRRELRRPGGAARRPRGQRGDLGGDLRPDPVDHEGARRRGGAAAHQHLRPRPGRLGVHEVEGPRPGPRPAHAQRHDLDQLGADLRLRPGTAFRRRGRQRLRPHPRRGRAQGVHPRQGDHPPAGGAAGQPDELRAAGVGHRRAGPRHGDHPREQAM